MAPPIPRVPDDDMENHRLGPRGTDFDDGEEGDREFETDLSQTMEMDTVEGVGEEDEAERGEAEGAEAFDELAMTALMHDDFFPLDPFRLSLDTSSSLAGPRNRTLTANSDHQVAASGEDDTDTDNEELRGALDTLYTRQEQTSVASPGASRWVLDEHNDPVPFLDDLPDYLIHTNTPPSQWRPLIPSSAAASSSSRASPLPDPSSPSSRRRKFPFDEDGFDSGSDSEGMHGSRGALTPSSSESSASSDYSVLLPTSISSFLRSGRTFHGTQNLMSWSLPPVGVGNRGDDERAAGEDQKEEWEVRVTIHNVDYKNGTVIGMMEALNVPRTTTTVVTYWEGEIVDFANYQLWTNNWQAKKETDLDHWKRFEAFVGIDDRRIIRGARLGYLPSTVRDNYILMRWKEKYFVNMSAQDSGLTIAGFYYICMRRSDGALEGYYYDPQSAPYQRLCLMPQPEGRGFGFAEFEFA